MEVTRISNILLYCVNKKKENVPPLHWMIGKLTRSNIQSNCRFTLIRMPKCQQINNKIVITIVFNNCLKIIHTQNMADCANAISNRLSITLTRKVLALSFWKWDLHIVIFSKWYRFRKMPSWSSVIKENKWFLVALLKSNG